MTLRSKVFNSLFTSLTAAVLLAACGGGVVSVGPTGADAGDDTRRSDTGVPLPSAVDAAPRTPEAGSEDTGRADVSQGKDASSRDAPVSPVDAGPAMGCFTPSRDSGPYYTCSEVACPSGTVCVQRDFDVTALVRCVAIPESCGAKPTCACMETTAAACVDPIPFLGCVDVDRDGSMPYLDFPCGCA